MVISKVSPSYTSLWRFYSIKKVARRNTDERPIHTHLCHFSSVPSQFFSVSEKKKKVTLNLADVFTHVQCISVPCEFHLCSMKKILLPIFFNISWKLDKCWALQQKEWWISCGIGVGLSCTAWFVTTKISRITAIIANLAL